MKERNTMRLSLDYPQIWFLGFAGAILMLGLAWGDGSGDLLLWPGVLLVLAGVGLIAYAVAAMRHARTTVDPYGRPTTLMTTGVFAVSRNPIYLGNALILTGLCLICNVMMVAVVIIPAFVLIINQRFLPREEAHLRAGFPQQFAEYSARTRRWI